MKNRRSTDAAIDCDKISDSDGLTTGSTGVSKFTLRDAIISGDGGTGELGLGGRVIGRVSTHEPVDFFHVNASESGVAWIGETAGIILS